MERMILITEREYEVMKRENSDVDRVVREVESRNWRDNFHLKNDRDFWKNFAIWLAVISGILLIFSLYLLYYLNINPIN